MTSRNSWRRITLLFRRLPAEWWFTILALLVWAILHGDYGITWDETVQSAYGEAVRKFFFIPQSFAEFFQANVPKNIFFYGPALDLVCATIARISGADIFAVRHGVQGLLWVAMFFPVCALGRRISGEAGAWFAGFALLGMPSLFGHAFNNPKDLPLASATIWLLHLSVTAAAARQLRWQHVLTLGGVLGFLLAMRPGAWFLGVLLALVPLAHCRRDRGPFAPTLGRASLTLVAAIVVGWILMILPWPSALHSPLWHPIAAARLAFHFDEVYPVLLGGITYRSNELPWNYLATYLVLTLPLPFLFLGAWGHFVFSRGASGSIISRVTALGVGFLFWFPLVIFIIARPNIYDGIRHFLFMLPPFAVIVGVAAADLSRRLSSILPQLLVRAAMIVFVLSAVPAMLRLHPYESVYYNLLAGPKATLHERYETDYWISSYREAAMWINEVQSHSGRDVKVIVAANAFSYPAFAHFLDKRVKVKGAPIGDFSRVNEVLASDYYVAMVRYNQWRNFPEMPISHKIERDGILLAVIRENPQTRNN